MSHRMKSVSPALLGWFAAVILVLAWAGKRADEAPQVVEALSSYAEWGPYAVGTTGTEIEAAGGLEITMWYPGRHREDLQEPIEYDYVVKMGNPLGETAVASYAGRAVRDAPFDLSARPYPLVVLSPGFAMGSSTYAWLAEHLASHGLVVIAPEHGEQLDANLDAFWQATITRPQDVQAVFAYVDGQASAGGKLEGFVDPENAAVIGHSYGGFTALAAAGARMDSAAFKSHCAEAQAANHPAYWLCEETLPHLDEMAALAGLESVPEGLWPDWSDPRVDAVIAMAGDAYMFGPSGLSGISAPLMAIGGTADEDAPYLWGTQPSFEHTASPRKVLVGLIDGGHMLFTGPCDSIRWYLKLFAGEFCDDGDWVRVQAHTLTRHFTTAFLLAELGGDPIAAQVLAEGLDGTTQFRYRLEGY